MWVPRSSPFRIGHWGVLHWTVVLTGCGTSRVEVLERAQQANVPPVSTPGAPTGSVDPLVPPPLDAGVSVDTSPVQPPLDAGTSMLPMVTFDAGACDPAGVVNVPRYRLSLRSNGNCLGVGEEMVADGVTALTTVVAADCGEHSLWQLIAVPGGLFEIRSITLGLNLEPLNRLSAPGTDIVLVPPEDEPMQHFRLVPLSNGYVSIPLGSVPNCLAESFTGKAELAAYDITAANQQWRLEYYACPQADAAP
jgi:hypothetical protein